MATDFNAKLWIKMMNRPFRDVFRQVVTSEADHFFSDPSGIELQRELARAAELAGRGLAEMCNRYGVNVANINKDVKLSFEQKDYTFQTAICASALVQTNSDWRESFYRCLKAMKEVADKAREVSDKNTEIQTRNKELEEENVKLKTEVLEKLKDVNTTRKKD